MTGASCSYRHHPGAAGIHAGRSKRCLCAVEEACVQTEQSVIPEGPNDVRRYPGTSGRWGVSLAISMMHSRWDPGSRSRGSLRPGWQWRRAVPNVIPAQAGIYAGRSKRCLCAVEEACVQTEQSVIPEAPNGVRRYPGSGGRCGISLAISMMYLRWVPGLARAARFARDERCVVQFPTSSRRRPGSTPVAAIVTGCPHAFALHAYAMTGR